MWLVVRSFPRLPPHDYDSVTLLDSLLSLQRKWAGNMILQLKREVEIISIKSRMEILENVIFKIEPIRTKTILLWVSDYFSA